MDELDVNILRNLMSGGSVAPSDASVRSSLRSIATRPGADDMTVNYRYKRLMESRAKSTWQLSQPYLLRLQDAGRDGGGWNGRFKLTRKREEYVIRNANVTVIVNNIERAVRFYTDVLGLKLKARYGDQFAEVEAKGTIIALHPAIEKGAQPGRSESLSIGFSVDKLDTAVDELKRKGVVFSRILDDAQVRLAFFTDPDGNPLYLSQSKWG
jgi:catechol 2,3-dioxygenase-like lactoylglutathione lyase family enzyme